MSRGEPLTTHTHTHTHTHTQSDTHTHTHTLTHTHTHWQNCSGQHGQRMQVGRAKTFRTPSKHNTHTAAPIGTTNVCIYNVGRATGCDEITWGKQCVLLQLLLLRHFAHSGVECNDTAKSLGHWWLTRLQELRAHLRRQQPGQEGSQSQGTACLFSLSHSLPLHTQTLV